MKRKDVSISRPFSSLTSQDVRQDEQVARSFSSLRKHGEAHGEDGNHMFNLINLILILI
jgi:hypothetical protein